MQKDLHDSYSPWRKKFVFLDFPWKTEYTLNCWEILKKKKKKTEEYWYVYRHWNAPFCSIHVSPSQWTCKILFILYPYDI